MRERERERAIKLYNKKKQASKRKNLDAWNTFWFCAGVTCWSQSQSGTFLLAWWLVHLFLVLDSANWGRYKVGQRSEWDQWYMINVLSSHVHDKRSIWPWFDGKPLLSVWSISRYTHAPMMLSLPDKCTSSMRSEFTNDNIVYELSSEPSPCLMNVNACITQWRCNRV